MLVHYTTEDFPSVLGTRTSVHAWLLIPMRKIVYKSSLSSSLKKVSAKFADMYAVVWLWLCTFNVGYTKVGWIRAKSDQVKRKSKKTWKLGMRSQQLGPFFTKQSGSKIKVIKKCQH